MSDRPVDFILIGVDGGASKVRAHEVRVAAGSDSARFRLGRASAVRTYPGRPFAPVPAQRQLDEWASGRIRVTPAETERGDVVAASIVECVTDVAHNAAASPQARVRLGIGMPGLKTADGRGIVVMNSGPRIPDLADRLEAGLLAADVDLLEPIARLGSDGEFCGVGEQYAADGLFRDVDHAYYLGGGTGLAEALKLHGSLVTFDSVRDWLAKAWEMQSMRGDTFEHLVSAAAINERFWKLRGDEPDVAAVSADIPDDHVSRLFPENHAALGDPVARQVLETAADALAELIFARMEAICRGTRVRDYPGTAPPRESGPAFPVRPHEDHGVLLQRVVLGQHLGRLYDDRRIFGVFRDQVDRNLAEQISAKGDACLRREYLPRGRLLAGLLRASRLPAAAALGAAINASRPSL